MNQSFEVIEKCDLCGAQDFEIIDESGHIVRCKRCGFKFTNPRSILSVEIKDTDSKYANIFSKDFDLGKRSQAYTRRQAIVRKYLPSGRILDIGAGLGEFLYMCQQNGKYEPHGTEVSEFCVSFARDKLGVQVDLGILEEIAYPAEYFDAVTMWHVLEHVPSPSKIINEISRILKKHGLVFFAVPNESWLGRPHFLKNAIKQFLRRIIGKKIFKIKKMYPIYEEEGNWHLSHFTPKTLRLFLKKNGFKVRYLTVDDRNICDVKKDPHEIARLTRALWISRLFGIIVYDAMLVVAERET